LFNAIDKYKCVWNKLFHFWILKSDNMKNIKILIFLLFAALHASAQIQFTAGINYESGVPSGAPSSTGSRLRVDLASGRIYQWSAANTTWRTLGQGIDIVAGCAAPAYTPGYAQSVFAVNGCNTPELYYYNGTQWKQVAGGGGGGGGTTYYAGTGIDIDANDTISIDTVPRLIFYSDQTYSGGVGAMRWNSDDGTLDLGLKGGNVTLQLGQELVQPVKHATNGGLDNGKVVYITGSSGDNKTVLYARANDEATSANTLGLMTETVTGGNKGFCTTFGLVRNINTSNLTEGGAVWLSKDTAGAMTAVRPEAPNHGVFIGFCVRKHASTGVIFVNVQNGYELNELHNVYAPSPTNGQVLTYVSGNSRWEAATVADQSATNELQTLSVATNTATLSNSGGSVTIAGGGINSASTVGSTITVTGTEVDGSVTNEIQTIDTFSLTGQTLRASLSNDNQAAKTVTLPVIDINAGSNVTVTDTNGVYTISSSGGGGGITGTGVTDYLPQWTSTSNIDTSGLYWSGGTLGIRTTTLNTTGIQVKSNTSGEAYNEGPELLTTGTGTGWTGTSFATGYTHTTGTTALTANGLTVESGVIYKVVVTVTGRSSGAVTATMGGLSSVAISTNTTVTFAFTPTTSTANFSVAVTTTFNGTVTASVKKTFAAKPVFAAENSSGTVTAEIRAPVSPTNTIIGVDAGGYITTGVNNTIIGNLAGRYLGTGSRNIIIGQNEARLMISGSDNTIINSGETKALTSTDNVLIGRGTTVASTTTIRGISIGTSIASTSTSINIGYNSTQSGTGTSNILIGSSATGTTNASSEIIIGSQNGMGSLTATIGRAAQTRTHLYGSLTMGTDTTSSGRLTVRGTGTSSAANTAIFEDSGGTDILGIRNDGRIAFLATNTASGTTGAQTINRPSGTVNFAAGATSLVVTNSLCTTSSIVLPVIRTNDATATIKNVVPDAGSFTINLTAAATAETSVGFFIIN
jgi:hypothetical protein